jgi:hypothetical protein
MWSPSKGVKNFATGTFSANEQRGRTGSQSWHCRANWYVAQSSWWSLCCQDMLCRARDIQGAVSVSALLQVWQ